MSLNQMFEKFHLEVFLAKKFNKTNLSIFPMFQQKAYNIFKTILLTVISYKKHFKRDIFVQRVNCSLFTFKNFVLCT